MDHPARGRRDRSRSPPRAPAPPPAPRFCAHCRHCRLRPWSGTLCPVCQCVDELWERLRFPGARALTPNTEQRLLLLLWALLDEFDTASDLNRPWSGTGPMGH